MLKPKALILSGYGLNCEEETQFAFETAGALAEIVHINDLIDNLKYLDNYQILVFPGGFAYGDDTGSGKAFANKVRNNLWENVKRFIQRDNLVLGICNGFQILANLDLFPVKIALTYNTSARYIVRWVDIKIENNTPWFKDIKKVSLPIAHGEGKFYADEKILKQLKQNQLIAARYYEGEICHWQLLDVNPNGSLDNIAAITDKTGRILGMMPHPERAVYFTQLPHWTYLKEKFYRENKPIPKYGPGLKIFQNAVKYFI